MKKKQTLKEQLWKAVNEYTRQLAELLECDYHDCHWIGTDDEGRGTFTVCDFGDTTILTLDEMQTIIDRLPEWEKRYGSRQAVAEEVREWMDWSLEEQHLTNGHPRINLEHWLMGCPREMPEPTIYDELAAYRDDMRDAEALIDKYGGERTLFDVKGKAQERIDTILPVIERRDAEWFKKVKNTEAYKEFEKTIKAAQEAPAPSIY